MEMWEQQNKSLHNKEEEQLEIAINLEIDKLYKDMDSTDIKSKSFFSRDKEHVKQQATEIKKWWVSTAIRIIKKGQDRANQGQQTIQRYFLLNRATQQPTRRHKTPATQTNMTATTIKTTNKKQPKTKTKQITKNTIKKKKNKEKHTAARDNKSDSPNSIGTTTQPTSQKTTFENYFKSEKFKETTATTLPKQRHENRQAEYDKACKSQHCSDMICTRLH
jgi:hypothetical protein